MKNTMLFSNNMINKLNELTLSISPGLLLFYQYNPKFYDDSMDEKSKLWMGITNIYTLFFDCGRFLFSGDNNLLRLFQKYKYIDRGSVVKLENFIFAIREIRGYYCHNKIENYNDMPSEWQKSGITIIETIMRPDALRDKSSRPDYLGVCEAIKQSVEKIYDVLFKTIEKIKRRTKDNSDGDKEIIQEWRYVQAKWLLETEEIRVNCIRSWYKITYMSVSGKLNPPNNLLKRFIKECEGIIQGENGYEEVFTAISTGKITIIDIYQDIYNKHEKEIKECIIRLQRV